MRNTPFLGRWVLIFVLLLVHRKSLAQGDGQAAPVPLPADIIAQWDARSQEVTTARIKGSIFRAASLGTMTLDDWERRLEALAAEPTPARLQTFYDRLRRDIEPAGGVIGPFEPSFEFITDGRSTSLEAWGDHTVRAADADVDTLGHRYQATVYSAGRSPFYTLSLDDFRMFPKGDVLREFVEEHSESAARRSFVRRSLTSDTIDRLVVELPKNTIATVSTTKGSEVSADTSFAQVRLQRHVTADPNGIMYPRFVASYQLQNGRISAVQVIAIAGAKFNVRVTPADFRVPAAAGTVMVDARIDPLRGDVWTLTRETSDVVATANKRRNDVASQPDPAKNGSPDEG